MKQFLFASLLCLMALGAQAQALTFADLPEPVQVKFSSEHGDLPSHVVPQWSHEKEMGGTNVLFKVSYMNGTSFETYVYSKHGEEAWRRFDWYHANQADAVVMKAVQEAYPARKLERISHLQSTRYSLDGWLIKMDDKSRHFDASGKENGVNLGIALPKAAFADASNFADVAAPATIAPAATAPPAPTAPAAKAPAAAGKSKLKGE